MLGRMPNVSVNLPLPAQTQQLPAHGPRLYVGRCECGAIRYRVELDLTQHDVRTGSVWERSIIASGFRLQTGHESLIGYQFAAQNAHHFFCTCCKTRAFSHHEPELESGYYTIDVKALELC
jgi:hypothetical protein